MSFPLGRARTAGVHDPASECPLWFWPAVCLSSLSIGLIAASALLRTNLASRYWGIAYLFILPVFLRRREYALASIAAAEVLLMALAASGLLRMGH